MGFDWVSPNVVAIVDRIGQLRDQKIEWERVTIIINNEFGNLNPPNGFTMSQLKTYYCRLKPNNL
ncbi:hypothetical protein DDB_G0271038 [Dictyostelium discoideum AX4]|uniref:Uncharacterized protein n=1 Tax=Dictyostelium discoideum TaxID=44689 RepID=Q55CC6_DICDI|nr:hypothetical protein DDB_G0271038 [Dictyostelium discoideum AX4]EAL72869.1 hypothetical protein DDB_G0271038 [Dictyostelium discoideum AX4]|eukprot:XP_646555.1 hypothetical protein DDB_G0271038 [Dictyostelium discoideum AX4]